MYSERKRARNRALGLSVAALLLCSTAPVAFAVPENPPSEPVATSQSGSSPQTTNSVNTPEANISTLQSPLQGSLAESEEPQTVILESVMTRGKSLMLGVPERRPLSLGTITADGRNDTRLLTLHPVAGDGNRFVIANGAGQVLVRDAGARSVSAEAIAPADAASEARKTWELRKSGDSFAIVNGEQFEGRDAALNVYGWNSSEGAEVATWDLGEFGANETFVVHQAVPEAQPISVVTAVGVSPTLPARVAASYSWGQSLVVREVEWQFPSDVDWNREGELEATAQAVGLFGEPVTLQARVIVGSPGDAQPTEIRTFAGATVLAVQLAAPDAVERRIGSSEETVTSAVSWDFSGLTDADFAQPGTVVVPAASDLGFSAELTVIVEEGTQHNVLRGTAVRAWREAGEEDLSKLTDGNRELEAWGTWREGGADNRLNPTWVAYYFDRPQQINGAAVSEAAGADNLGSVQLQYRDLRGGWVNVAAGDEGTFANTGGALAEDYEFPSVTATGFRFVFSHKSNATWMQLAELEVFGPTLGDDR